MSARAPRPEAMSADAIAGSLADPKYDHNAVAEKKIRRAKRHARSEISVSKMEWQRFGYAQKDPKDVFPPVDPALDTLERVDCSGMSRESFYKKYDSAQRPLVLLNLTNDWPCQDWTVEGLAAKFPNHKVKIGTDDDGYAVKLKLKYYAHYASSPYHRRDDSPLYVFDGTYHEKEGMEEMVHGYQVPELFAEDLMGLLRPERRPPYRWVVMGPPRSGTFMHQDPLGTSAWNALLSGHKRWVILPPSVPRSVIIPPGAVKEGVTWFGSLYRPVHDWAMAHNVEFIDCIQKPGETMYVPSDWWHVVVNLDDTVAVTQNFTTSNTFRVCWRAMHRGRPKLSQSWRKLVQRQRPDLYQLIEEEDEKGYSDPSSQSSSSSSATDTEDDDEQPSKPSEEAGDAVEQKNDIPALTAVQDAAVSTE